MKGTLSKIVMKFGGTSVQDSKAISNVINIVKNTDAMKIVVVSAVAKGTNSLEQIARLSSESNTDEAKNILETLINRHYKIIDELIQGKELKALAAEKISAFRGQIEELISGLGIIRELTLRTLDAFRVFGELMSSTVISYAMKNAGIDVELIDSRSIIKTNNEFSRAYPDFDLTQANVNEKLIPLLNKGKTILAQGFIASTTDGISTTMGRESSDFSAAIYGAMINADEIQIWTDVDGVLTADPNIISNTLKLSEISFQEMEELSNFGAKVLHKNSIKPAFKKNIPIRVLNSKNISSSGTIIKSELNYPLHVKSVTYKNNIIVLRLKPKETLSQYIFWEMFLNILSKHKPQIDILVSSNNAIIVVIAENNYTKIHYGDLKNEMDEISDFKIIKDKALVTIIGSNLYEINNFEKRIFCCIPDIKAESVVFGFNSHSFSLLLDADKMEPSLKNIHKEFFENETGSGGLYEKNLYNQLITSKN
jgi:aspartate kinase